MKFPLSLLILLLLSIVGKADDDVGLGFDYILGGGFGYQQLQITQGGGNSKYSGGRWSTDLGVNYNWSKSVNALAAVEYGQSESDNGVGSNSFLEHLSNQFHGAKLGVFLGRLGVGGGMRVNNFSIESVSISDGAQRETFSANTTFGFVGATIRQRSYQISFEGQYHTGTVDSRSISEIDIALKFFFVF